MWNSRRLRVLLAVLILTCVTLIVLSLRDDEGNPLRGVGASVFGPLERGVSAVVTPIGGFFSGLASWKDSADRIHALEEENARLKALVADSANERARADQLDKLLKLAGAGQYRIVPGQVVAIGPAQDYAWTVTIDAGSRDGITTDMTVINGDGLVGRVIGVSEGTCTVALVVDATTSVGGRIATTQEIGVVEGNGTPTSLEMQLLDPLAPVEIGSPIVTFGSQNDRPYVPGVPIGVVTELRGAPGALTRIAVLKPYVDVTALNIVGIVVEPPRVDPRDSVLPPTPEPTPSPTSTASP